VTSPWGPPPGTFRYMAPELHLAEAYDGKVDQYALAVTVYELLSGQPPFEGSTSAVIAVKQSTQTPVPLDELMPSVGDLVAKAVQRALARKPDERLCNLRLLRESGAEWTRKRRRRSRPPKPWIRGGDEATGGYRISEHGTSTSGSHLPRV